MPRKIRTKPREWLWRTLLWSVTEDIANAIVIVLLSSMFLFVSALLVIDLLWSYARFCTTRCVAFLIPKPCFASA